MATLKPQNIMGEFDQISKLFGEERYVGEKIRDFVPSSVGSISAGYADELAMQEAFTHTARASVGSCCVRVDTSNSLIPVVTVTEDNRLLLSVHDLTVEPSVETKYEFDLISRKVHPFLDDLLFDINSKSNDLLVYKLPYGEGRDYSLLPSMIFGNQKNTLQGTSGKIDQVDTKLEHSLLIPGTMSLDLTSMDDTDAAKVVLVEKEADLSGDYDLYIDHIKGRVKTKKDLSKDRISLTYDYLDKDFVLRFSCAVSLAVLGNPEPLTRFLSENLADPRSEFEYDSTNAKMVYRTYSALRFPSEMRQAISRGKRLERDTKRYS